ncbi:pyocin knob domain-containing protein [Aquimarina algiphila]|uniref:pyocin knob domain-containing protein n=1 Tax=Aquimarina algiphila TaxID=2047982 RepID=UPI0024907654|nr:pyocin knob domain-containing protein [Aquimarina algiphila]
MSERITYNEKTNPRPVEDRTKQATAEDFNEIKEVVNAHADDIEKSPSFGDIPSVADDLISTVANAALSANQGVVLKGFIDQILSLLNSDDTTLDELQEIVNYIKQNKDDLQNLTIANIAGLPEEFIKVYNTIKDSFTASNIDIVLDWNTVSNNQPGTNIGLIRGNATNGPTPDDTILFYSLCFEYGSNDGTGVITQIAIPYGDAASLAKGLFYRGRNSDVWSAWIPLGSGGESGGSSTGLEMLTENGNAFWALVGRDPLNYGDRGAFAIDFSLSNNPSTTRGATGVGSVAFGTSDSPGLLSFAANGDNNSAGDYSASFNSDTDAEGYAGFSAGEGTSAPSYVEFSIGSYGTQYTAGSATEKVGTDRLFNAANGTSLAPSDAFTILKNGAMILHPVPKSSIASPVAGTFITDSDDANKIKFHDGTNWNVISMTPE